MTIREAVLILYKGQSNVKLMANKVGISLEAMQEELNGYMKITPVDPDDWKSDVDTSWPYSGN